MRALRKIIFINSANIRYAEVNVDGNVHFIGTQGVGKSTLLRAILFFYNADKLHLGIPKEKRTFDEFYLPNSNSYIVYEVEHEHGPFSILVFRSSGRACYRFIDAAFNKEWLIDQYGEVTNESKVIRERIGKAYMSRIIDRYEQYKDILYGNYQETGKEFQRFQLMESNKYQNIPRSIQNVFLNSRLDADFIKDIIIRSMNEDEANIDLGYFRRQVSDFEQEFKDISCWYRLNQKGESTVRKQADNVVRNYQELLYLERQVRDLCAQLKYAEHADKEKLPLIREKINKLDTEYQRQSRLLEELQKKCDFEKQDINRKIGVVSENLNKCKELTEHYNSQNIDQVYKRAQQWEIVQQRLFSYRQRYSVLTAKYDDISGKYRKLEEDIKQQFESFRQLQQSHIQKLDNERLLEIERMIKDCEIRKTEIETEFAEKNKIISDNIELLRREQSNCEKSLHALEFEQPYKQEIVSLEKELQQLSLREKELDGFIGKQEAQINLVQLEYDKKEEEISIDFSSRISNEQSIIEKTESDISNINDLLSRIQGSLYEWLASNIHGWESTIGRVIDEQRVLYQTGLHPKQTEISGSLYGIELDLSDLPISVRKPDELKSQKMLLETEIEEHRKNCTILHQQRENAIEELRHEYSPLLKEMRQNKSMLNAELQNIPKKQKSIRVKIDDFRIKGENEKANKKTQLEGNRLEIVHNISMHEAEREKLNDDKSKKLRVVNKNFDDKKEKLCSNTAQKKEEILSEIHKQQLLVDSEISALKMQEMEELTGKGADTNAVQEIKDKIAALEQESHFIDQHRELVYNYLRDKKDLFDKEGEFQTTKQTLVDRLHLLEEKYFQRKQNHEQSITSINEENKALQSECIRIEDGLNKLMNFRQDNNICPAFIDDVNEKQTLNTPSEIIDDIKSVIVSRQTKQNTFRQNVNIFKSNFTAKNTFNFRMELTTDEDYGEFASNLDDFIINNKIEEYRRRTSERYVNILSRVSKEMGELTRHESDVDKIIHDINNDFKERNFVGVIKLIALQSVPSADKMVQLMKRIKVFNDENQFAMGEMNLFSTVNRDDVNKKAVDYLLDFMKALTDNPSRQYLTLSDLFQLQFRVVENDNDTGWADKISHVGSEGTDTLVKAMVNIMLINVFKEKVSKKFGDFSIHCMMDEIGKLHPQNVKGILDFANARNINLINSSPTTYNVSDYRYTYLLQKDAKSKTVIRPLISQK